MKPKHVVLIAMLFGAQEGMSTGTTWASCDSRPGIPTNLIAKNIAPGEISLNWQSVGNVHCFDIEISKDGKPVSQSITGGNCGKTNFIFKDLGYNQNYCFNVRARTEGGTQGCVSAQSSNTVCSVTSNPPLTTGQQPPAPNNQIMVGVEFTGPSYSHQEGREPPEACQSLCLKDQKCQAWTWTRLVPNSGTACDLKSIGGPTKKNEFTISGLKDSLIVK